MYTGCPKIGHVCTCKDPLQDAYTYVTSLKRKINSQAHAGSIGMEDQNPLKTQKITETQKIVNKPIKNTQKQKIP
jgi:hypothetical protein